MKVSNPYNSSMSFKGPDEIVSSQNSKAAGKAVARFPHKPLRPSTSNGQAGKMKARAMTPGTSPTGS
jgi:hypothetical protein